MMYAGPEHRTGWLNGMERVRGSRLKTTELVYIAMCTVLIAVCSWISIPSAVPFTLQTFAVFIVLELLGGKRGTITIGLYILLAAIGVPVLAGFNGGPGAVLGITGGYLLGFVFIGLAYWFGELTFGRKLPARVAMLATGLMICYLFGTAWFMTLYTRNTAPVSLATALSWCVFPFIIPDMIKLSLAVVLSSRLRKMIHL